MHLLYTGAVSLVLCLSCHQPNQEYKEGEATTEVTQSSSGGQSEPEIKQIAPKTIVHPTNDQDIGQQVTVESQTISQPTDPVVEPEVTEADSPVLGTLDQPIQAEANAPPSNTAWDQLLRKYVTPTGEVNYRGLLQERHKLNDYLLLLRHNPIRSSWTRDQQLTYWINAYNAFTVELILQNYPLKSIMDLDKPWDKKFIRLGNNQYSLNQIEHEIVRPQFRDARIHFALVCAATSCPKLLNRAYQSESLDQQLNAQTRYFLNESGKNKLASNRVQISQLFNWYGEDFIMNGSIIDFLNKYAAKPINKNASIVFVEYDWSLNE